MKKYSIIALIGIGVGIFILGWKNPDRDIVSFLEKPADATQQSTRQIALSCITPTDSQFHATVHLSIVVDGVAQPIPADIGVSDGCTHPIHTLDANGTIHIDSPVNRIFTLSDFFAVWEKPFGKNQVLDNRIDNDDTISTTVNGKPVSTFGKTVLNNGDSIIISYLSKP